MALGTMLGAVERLSSIPEEQREGCSDEESGLCGLHACAQSSPPRPLPVRCCLPDADGRELPRGAALVARGPGARCGAVSL